MEPKELQNQIRYLKAEIKVLNETVTDYRQQIDRHREFIVKEFLLQNECKNQQHYPPSAIILRIAKHMSAQKNWFW